jgi:hypothetical protein
MYCVVLAGAFVALALLKLRGRMEEDETAAGLAYVLSLPAVRLSAAVGELAIAAVLCTRWRALGGVMGATWIAVLSGLYIAMLALGVPTRTCGCLGPVALPDYGHVLLLAGLGTVAWLVLATSMSETSSA